MKLIQGAIAVVSLFGGLWLVGTYIHGPPMYLFVFLVIWAIAVGLVLPVVLSILSLQRCDCPTCQDRRLRQLFRRPSISPSLQQPTTNGSSQRIRGTRDA